MSTGPWLDQYAIRDVCDTCVAHKNGDGEVLIIHFSIGQLCQWCQQCPATCRIRWKLWKSESESLSQDVSIIRDNRD